MRFTLSQHAIARRMARDLSDGFDRTHLDGRCGYMGSLCGDCHTDEFNEMLTWANKQPDPLPNESLSDYWKRIGGRFLDAWHDVASKRVENGGASC